jgi:hypothetical protein
MAGGEIDTLRPAGGGSGSRSPHHSRAIVSNNPAFPKKVPIVLIATCATLPLAAAFVTTGELLAGNVYRPAVPADHTAIAHADGAASSPPPAGVPPAADTATPVAADPRLAARKAIADLVAALRARTDSEQSVCRRGPALNNHCFRSFALATQARTAGNISGNSARTSAADMPGRMRG